MRTEARKTDRRRRLLAAASGLLFCASCVVSPVVRFDDTPEGWQVLTPALLSDGTGADLGGFGFAYLLTGWMGLIYGASCLGNLAWLANAGYFAAIVLFLRDKRREARTAAAAALLLGSMFLRCDGLILSESGTVHPILARGPACGLWLAAFAVLAAGMAIDGLLCRKHE